MSDHNRKTQSASSAPNRQSSLKVQTVKLSKTTSDALRTTVTRRDLGKK